MHRVRRTVMEMLRDRGYEVDEQEIKLSEEEFKQKLEITSTQNFFATRYIKDDFEDLEELNPENE